VAICNGCAVSPRPVPLLAWPVRRTNPEVETVRRLWRDYGLSITLATLFLVAWTLQTWMGWSEFVASG